MGYYYILLYEENTTAVMCSFVAFISFIHLKGWSLKTLPDIKLVCGATQVHRVTSSHLVPHCSRLQRSADPAAQHRSGRLARMSDVLQLIEHVRLRPSGPLTLLHQLPLLSPRAGGVQRGAEKRERIEE